MLRMLCQCLRCCETAPICFTVCLRCKRRGRAGTELAVSKTLAMLATCCAAPVGPEMRVARVKNSPEPAEHGLHLGAALAAATRRRPAFARLLPFALYQTKSKSKQKRMRGAASNRRHSRRHSYGRVEPGTRTAPILGHRVVRVRWYPARFLKFCRRHGGEPHLPATGPTLRSSRNYSSVSPWEASGAAACRPP